MNKIYCMYCGEEINPRDPNDVRVVMSANNDNKLEVVRICPKRQPKETCDPYEGSEKLCYTCKFCGQLAGDIKSLTNGRCDNNTKGGGYHVPKV